MKPCEMPTWKQLERLIRDRPSNTLPPFPPWTGLLGLDFAPVDCRSWREQPVTALLCVRLALRVASLCRCELTVQLPAPEQENIQSFCSCIVNVALWRLLIGYDRAVGVMR